MLASAEDEEHQRRGHGEEPGERAPEEEIGRRDAGAQDAQQHVDLAPDGDGQGEVRRDEPRGLRPEDDGRRRQRERRAAGQPAVSFERDHAPNLAAPRPMGTKKDPGYPGSVLVLSDEA